MMVYIYIFFNALTGLLYNSGLEYLNSRYFMAVVCRDLMFAQYKHLSESKSTLFKACKVKTVKEQTFHKRSTSVPISNRNETKTFEFVPEFVLSKEIISVWSRRADSGPNRNNLFPIRKIWERY